MSDGIKYTCNNCGKEHEEWPALTYISPTNYDTPSPCRCSPQPGPLLRVVTNNRSAGHKCNYHLNSKQLFNQHNELENQNCPHLFHKTRQKNNNSLPALHSTSIFHVPGYGVCSVAFE
jgi:hypothetical protein